MILHTTQQNDQTVEVNSRKRYRRKLKIINPLTGEEIEINGSTQQNDQTMENDKNTKTLKQVVEGSVKKHIEIIDLTGNQVNFETIAQQNDKTIEYKNSMKTDASNASTTAFRQTNGGANAKGIVKDNETENDIKWKPLRKDLAILDLDEDEKKTLFTLRIFRSQLNKITPEIRSGLTHKIKNLTIDNSIRMQGIVDIIFEKAISEPNYVQLYAQICLLLKDKQIVNETGALKTFSLFLLERCMKNVDICLSEHLMYERKKFEIDLIDCKKTKKLLMKEYLHDKAEDNERCIKNCFFISELFKCGIIQREEIVQLMDRLSKSSANVALICIYTILRAIDEDHQFGKVSSVYYEKLEPLDEKELPFRTCLLLEKLSQLRENSWFHRIRSNEHYDVNSNVFKSIDLADEVEDSVVDSSINEIPMDEKEDDVALDPLSRRFSNWAANRLKE